MRPEPLEVQEGELLLRPPTHADVPAITRACQDPEIQRRTVVPVPYTEADARTYVAMCADALEDGTGVHAVAVDGSGTLLGAFGVRIDLGQRTGDVGYWVAPDARRRGVATRATRLVARHAFEVLDLGRLQLVAAVGNAASNGVARRLGFTREGRLREALIDGPRGDPQAPRTDATLYGLLPGELT